MKWYWQSYCALLLLAGYGQMLRKILTDTGGFSSRYGGAIVATALVFTLIAKARAIPLWNPIFWKAVFALLGFSCLVAVLFTVYLAVIGIYFSASLLLIAALLLAPAAQQIYAYAYLSPLVWKSKA